ncbi:hypothetical protein SUDANB15_02616 [Streptomyces sp. enrichment culture]|uniref:hypothetical protein n=1 Tax=Streptomyces sp. enrichment culture TaxID=1795815 RepID=UPI003F55222A
MLPLTDGNVYGTATITIAEVARQAGVSEIFAANTIARAERVGLLRRIGPHSWELTLPADTNKEVSK